MKELKIIAALDAENLPQALRLVQKVSILPAIYGFKIGFSLGLRYGLRETVREIRMISPESVLIYDHQKAATDIPDIGGLFARTLSFSGIDEAIIFPQSGPRTLEEWTKALMAEGLKVVVGGLMTHHSYLSSEGGYIDDGAVVEIYKSAARLGVKAFVIPLTKPRTVRGIVEQAGLSVETEFYSPGYGVQGGRLSEFGFLRKHFLILGRSLLHSDDPEALIRKIQAEVAMNS